MAAQIGHDVQVHVFANLSKKAKPLADPPKLERHDLATIVYTSGTTGKPKGVMLSHGNLLHQMGHRLAPSKPYDDAEPLPGKKMVLILPVWHITDQAFELWQFSCGCCVVYLSIRHFKADLAELPALLDKRLCDEKVDVNFSKMHWIVLQSANVFCQLGVTKGVNVAINASCSGLGTTHAATTKRNWLDTIDAATIYSRQLCSELNVPLDFVVPASPKSLPLPLSWTKSLSAPTEQSTFAKYFPNNKHKLHHNITNNWPWPEQLWGLPLGWRLRDIWTKGTYLKGASGLAHCVQLDAPGFDWLPTRK